MGDHKHKSKDSKRKSSKKEHREHTKHRSSKYRHESSAAMDYSDPSLWIEKSSETPDQPAPPVPNEPQPEQPQEGRHGWMMDASLDFGDFGAAKAKPKEELKPHPDEPKVSHRELNVHLKQGLAVSDYPEEKKRAIKFGDAGSNWRMMKLKRVIEQAEDEKRSVEAVGLERYGTMDKWQEALDERAYLDQRKRPKHRHDRHHDRSSSSHEKSSSSSSRKFMFSNTTSGSGGASSQFMRPSHASTSSPSRHQPSPSSPSSREPSRGSGQVLQEPHQPSPPSAPMPPPSVTPVITAHQQTTLAGPVLTRDQLNKLNAKIVKARLMDDDDLVEELEAKYNKELERFESSQHGGVETSSGANVQILPTVDHQGKMYDYAMPSGNSQAAAARGNKRFEGSHDKVTGERLRYSAADDAMSLMDMVRQERVGSRRATDMDMDFANRIVADASFENNLDYMDDRADVMAAKKGMSEEQKMRHAITDHKRTQQALESCRFCYHNDIPPQLAMISLATQTYLALPNTVELTPGHCFIVPLQHVTSMLECDDDVWTEVRNFQKCLMKMFHEKRCGVIFMETVLNLRSHRHTVIEAIPIPYGQYEDASAYFKEAIMSSGEEWSQHKKVIETTPARGFRNAMVKNLPYFHVWFGLDKGYGHVIENAKEFPHWFGKEVVGGMLDLSPVLWRKPKYHHKSDNQERQLKFLADWEKWDWTASLPV